MEDKVTLFGNIAHNLAEDVERILIITEDEIKELIEKTNR